ncbi:MAG TPA: DUF72 domain-containing protein [Polyangiaceae bacterium]|jgi:uncharacterized protein YecE (DUF72 family)|nr:DUF72 domain-containing protein [Polyangiaceae bacterium]
MSTRWHIGAKHLRGAIAAYAKRFDLLEVRAARAAQPGETADAAPGPSVATLKRWRKSVPPPFDFAVVAGPHLSRVKASEAADQEVEAAIAAIDALQARCFVLRTPPDVTPTSLWRDRIGKIVARIPHDVTHFVWEPSGVWEVPDAAAQAREWGAVLALDPAREVVPPGPVAYLRLRALGETQAFSPLALERIVDKVGPRRDVFAIIETDTAQAEAKRLRQIARKGRPEAVGGGGRLIRPRGAIIVRDDEQE